MTGRPSKATELESKVREAVERLENLLAPSDIRGRSVLADLIARAEQPFEADGMPRGTGLGGRRGARVVVIEDDAVPVTATEAMAFDRMDDICGAGCDAGKVTLEDGRVVTCRRCSGSGRRWADPVGQMVAQIEESLREVFRTARIIDRKSAVVRNAVTVERGRVSSLQGTCCIQACGVSVSGIGEDRLRRGYCPRCAQRWYTWRLKNETADPGADRRRFDAYMTIWIAEHAGPRLEVVTGTA